MRQAKLTEVLACYRNTVPMDGGRADGPCDGSWRRGMEGVIT